MWMGGFGLKKGEPQPGSMIAGRFPATDSGGMFASEHCMWEWHSLALAARVPVVVDIDPPVPKPSPSA